MSGLISPLTGRDCGRCVAKERTRPSSAKSDEQSCVARSSRVVRVRGAWGGAETCRRGTFPRYFFLRAATICLCERMANLGLARGRGRQPSSCIARPNFDVHWSRGRKPVDVRFGAWLSRLHRGYDVQRRTGAFHGAFGDSDGDPVWSADGSARLCASPAEPRHATGLLHCSR